MLENMVKVHPDEIPSNEFSWMSILLENEGLSFPDTKHDCHQLVCIKIVPATNKDLIAAFANRDECRDDLCYISQFQKNINHPIDGVSCEQFVEGAKFHLEAVEQLARLRIHAVKEVIV